MEEDRGETLPGCPGVRIPVSTAGRAWVPCLVREGRYQCLISWYFSVPQSCRALGDPWSAARQASLSLTISQSWLKLTSIQSVMPSNYLTDLCRPFSSCPQSFPASGSFLMSRLFLVGGQSIRASASASVLPVNIQD